MSRRWSSSRRSAVAWLHMTKDEVVIPCRRVSRCGAGPEAPVVSQETLWVQRRSDHHSCRVRPDGLSCKKLLQMEKEGDSSFSRRRLAGPPESAAADQQQLSP